MVHAFARAVSILGHPMLVLPVAALLLATRTLGVREAAWMALGFAAFAALVMGWSGWQVRRGRWQHVDASRHEERRTLNRFLLVALALAAVLGWVAGQPVQLALGLILAAALIAVAMRARGGASCRCTWPSSSMRRSCCRSSIRARYIAGLAFAALVAWSRLKLRRHVPRDLVAGALAGATAGGLFVWLAPKLAGA